MECPRCHGTGTCIECRGEGTIPCVACEGTGTRRRTSGQEITCNRCKGTGREACSPKCESCRGAGEITQEHQREQSDKYSPPRLVAALPYRVHVTLALIAAFVLDYLVMGALYGGQTLLSPTGTALRDMGALVPALFRQGEYWRILSYAFLHIGLTHIVFNTVALLQAGQILERQIGGSRFLVVFVLSAIGGGLADLQLHSNPWVHVAGASGGLCGLIGFGVAYGAQTRDAPQRAFFVQWAVYTLVFSVMVGADHQAHGGGFVTGALLGFVMGRLAVAAPTTPEEVRPLDRVGWPALATLCASACLVALGFVFVNLSHTRERATARELLESGRPGEALVALERIVARYPADLEAQELRAGALEASGDSERALEFWNASIARDGDDPHARMKRAVLLAGMNRPEQARSDLEALRRLGRGDSAEYILLQAQYNMALEKWDEARVDLERLLDHDLAHPEVVETLLAQCEYHTGRSREALARLDRLVKGASDGRFRDDRMWLHFYLGDYQKALDDGTAWLASKGYQSDTAAYVALVRHASARLLGKDGVAARGLQEALTKGQAAWPRPILRHLAHEIDLPALLAEASTNDRMTEARTWVGLDLLASSEPEQAREQFLWVKQHGNRRYAETEVARVCLRNPVGLRGAASPGPTPPREN